MGHMPHPLCKFLKQTNIRKIEALVTMIILRPTNNWQKWILSQESTCWNSTIYLCIVTLACLDMVVILFTVWHAWLTTNFEFLFMFDIRTLTTILKLVLTILVNNYT